MSSAAHHLDGSPLVSFTRRDRGHLAGLPAALTPLLGREREVAAVRALLVDPDVRLVTLTGAGGVGKTRLAIAAASAAADAFADGVAFVPLAALADADLAPVAIAQAIGSPQPVDRPVVDVVRADLRARHLLLVLDNLEHLVAAAPTLVDLLRACPRLNILVTSRIRLRVTGEHVYPVPSLPLPDGARANGAGWSRAALPGHPAAQCEIAHAPASPAVALFLARAHAIRPNFVPSASDLVAIAEICRRLDGLPLAIELAAARIDLLSPPALLARLDRALPLLTGGAWDRPPHQRTMRDAIAWSYDLLAPDAQTLFRRLAAFAGGFTLDAAARVAGGRASADAPLAVLDPLAGLIDAGLVRRADAAASDAADARFAMADTVREDAADRLAASGEEAAVRDAHAAWVLDLAETVEAHLLGADRGGWLDRIAREHDNCRTALAWLRQRGDAVRALRLAGAACHLWWQAGHYGEGRFQIEATLALPPSPESDHGRAKALTAAGALALMDGEPARAAALHEASLPLFRAAGDRVGLALADLCLHQAAAARGDYAAADRFGQEALALGRALALPQIELWALSLLGSAAVNEGADDRAEPLLADALRRARSLGDDATVARILLARAELALHRGDPQRAADASAEATALAGAGDPSLAAEAMAVAGRVALARRDRSAAAVQFREGAALATDLGDRRIVIECVEGLAGVAAAQGDAELAARLLSTAHAARQASDLPLPPAAVRTWTQTRAKAEALLGPERFTAAWGRAGAQSLDGAVAVASASVATGEPWSSPSIHLTPREAEVLPLLVAGRGDREIAAALSISRRTVQGHVAALFAKLGVHTRTAAATAAIAAGLVPPPRRHDAADCRGPGHA
ncbi:MAG: hypothetical protein IT336_07080 [Thermomicrobiales bacterium]|nr:hypothetical protein [Thermomicrobiales bacterium]